MDFIKDDATFTAREIRITEGQGFGPVRHDPSVENAKFRLHGPWIIVEGDDGAANIYPIDRVIELRGVSQQESEARAYFV
ncbi:MAG: hypothetical protein JWP40_988 [Blastococcus sp.]|nr:hypothetical protein [Blastococcus sp.]